MTIAELLAKPDTLLEWAEPWAGRADGKTVDADVTIRASVASGIKIRRWELHH
jgi:hypothetical protein